MNQRVLIASDDPSFLTNFVLGYRANGMEPILGRANFLQGTASAGYCHILWPEELVDWQKPDPAAIALIEKLLVQRKESSAVIQTVNNIYPHGCHGDPAWHSLYSSCLRSADVIHHFSQASLKLVNQEYPEFAGALQEIGPPPGRPWRGNPAVLYPLAYAAALPAGSERPGQRTAGDDAPGAAGLEPANL